MKKINMNNTLGSSEKPEDNTLSISCFDSMSVKARMTFDSSEIQGINVTYWMDDAEDLEERVDAIFGTLFEEVIKARESNKKAVVKR